MNRSPSGLLISLCIDGFVKYKTAEGLQPRTVDSFEWVLKKWLEKMGDKPINKVTPADVRDYLAYLRTEYVPHTFAKQKSNGEPASSKLSQKNIAKPLGNLQSIFWMGSQRIQNRQSDG
jgi:integrase/recombinase XerD